MISKYFKQKIHNLKLKYIKKWCADLGLVPVVLKFEGGTMYLKANDGSYRKVGRR